MSLESQIILASSSKYRKDLLSRILNEFECISPDIDETPFPDEEPIEHVARLAEQKALAIAINHPDAIVIGSDQVCVLDGQILSKPGNQENAVKQLIVSSGKSVYFYTSLCVTKGTSEPNDISVVATKVTFKDLSKEEIESYVKIENPIDCAGSFKCEGLGIALFEAIESKDPTALIGLPLIETVKSLKNYEIYVLQ